MLGAAHPCWVLLAPQVPHADGGKQPSPSVRIVPSDKASGEGRGDSAVLGAGQGLSSLLWCQAMAWPASPGAGAEEGMEWGRCLGWGEGIPRQKARATGYGLES